VTRAADFGWNSGLAVADAVEDVPAEGVTFREIGVVEVFGGVVGHAEFFHDAAGAEICRDGEGDEVGEIEVLEGVVEDGAGAFGGEALAPVVG